MDTDYDRIGTGGLCQRVCGVFSLIIVCTDVGVQATTLALVYAGCVLVNAHLAGPFVITNFLLLVKGTQQAQQEGIQDGKS